MASQANNRGLYALALEERAFDMGQAKLEELSQRLIDADSDIKEQLFSLVNGYKATCQRLAARRAQIILEMSLETPNAAQRLEGDKRYLVSVPEQVVFDQGGVLIAYMPAEEPNHLGQNGPAIHPADGDKGHPEVKREQPDVEAFNPPAARLPIHNQDQSNNIEDHAPKNAAPENVAAENVAPALPTGGLRQRHQAPHLVYSEKRSPTLQPPIERSKIANYWVFDYTFKQQQYLFIMRCPSPNCQNAIFTHHPLKRNRAADHFRACGMHFRNERDMVQRYARQVVTGRKDRVLRQAWARMHNQRLLAADEMHLDEENL